MPLHLGIDPSLTAFAMVDLDEEGAVFPKLIATRPADFGSFQARLHHIGAEFERHLSARRPTLAAIEGFSHGSRRAGTKEVEIAAVGSLARLSLWRLGIPFIEVPPSTLKKWISGKGSAEKNLMLREVYKRWGYNAVDDNDADAYALAQLCQRWNAVVEGTKTAAKLWQQIVKACTRVDGRPVASLS